MRVSRQPLHFQSSSIRRALSAIGLILVALTDTAPSAIVGEEPLPRDKLPAQVFNLRASAENGSAEAALELGKLYAEGKVVAADAKESESWLRKAYEAELAEAANVLAVFLLQTSNEGQDVERAAEGLSLLQDTAETNPDSALTLGQLHAGGKFVSADFAEAERLFQLAANLGSSNGSLWLGRLYSGEIGFPENKAPAKAEEYLEKAFAEENFEAGRLLVQFLREGTVLPKDEQRAFQIVAQAAEGGNAEAQLFLGQLYQEGSGTPVDPGKAVASFLAAAEAGNLKAMNRLGELYAFGGLSVERDPAEARKWFTQASEAGFPAAHLGLALLIDQETTPTSSEAPSAAENLVLAASAGIPEAQDRLGSWYRDGHRVPKDLVAAAAWFRMAVSSGNVSAMINLAQILEANARSADDLKNVLALYNEAATKGHPVAHFHLARLFSSGITGTVELPSAHAHASKSAGAGFSSAATLVSEIEATLTAEQKADSVRLQESMTVLPWSGSGD